MAEAMTVESMIQAYWHMEHYFTMPRFSFRKERDNGTGYSDIDLLAFKVPQWTEIGDESDRGKTILVLCESKAHGEKNKIKFDDFNKEKFNDFTDKSSQHDLIKFYLNIHHTISHKSLDNLIDLRTLDKLKLQFVSTALHSNDGIIKKRIEEEIKAVFIDKYETPKDKFEVELEITTHFDIIKKLFVQVQKDDSGKRYGNPVLDFVRELNRYLTVQECDGKKSIQKSDGVEDNKIEKVKQLQAKFLKEFNDTIELIKKDANEKAIVKKQKNKNAKKSPTISS